MLVNGEFADSVQANDRGLMYGDGVFRTFRIENGVPQHWDRHYRKLARDCEALGLACPEKDLLTTELMLVAKARPDCVAKLIVTRGAGGRGYLPEASLEPTRIVLSSPVPDHAKLDEVRVRLCDIRLSLQPRLAGIKHLNRLENVLARMEWNDPEISEGLLLDADDRVIEGTMSSLFLYRGGRLIAPDLARCGVDGVQRERVFEFSAACNIPVQVMSFGIEFLMQAEEVFLVNSVIGLWQVTALERTTWNRGRFCEALREWLR